MDVNFFGEMLESVSSFKVNSTFKEYDCDFVLSGEDAIPYFFTTYKKLFILVVPTVVAFGLFGNAALLFVVYRVHNMRKIKNFYLSNLAVSDAMFRINAAFQYIELSLLNQLTIQRHHFQKGIYMCNEWSGVVFLLFCISVLGYSCDIRKVSHHMSSLDAQIGER